MAELDIKELLRQKAEKLSKQNKPVRGIHSPLHALAKEISEYCGEPKEFAMYLGVVKNLGLSKAYRIFSEIKHSPNVTTRGKLFLFKSKYKRPNRERSARSSSEGYKVETKDKKKRLKKSLKVE